MTACRFCGAGLTVQACDFGAQPLANRLVPLDAAEPDPRYPLRVMVCADCLLVQLEQTVDPASMFSDYNYQSSVSAFWQDHAAAFAAMAVDRFALGRQSLVIEVASNDGCWLRPFLGRGIACLGIDPAANLATAARGTGIPTLTAFFGEAVAGALARDGQRADLLVANNVLAHVPDLMDFVRGLAIVLAPTGVLSVEVPHVLAMLDGGQFDTVYHEHVCYFSATVLQRVFAAVGLAVFDADILPTHGGSLRLLAQHADTGRQPNTPALERIILTERAARLHQPERYMALSEAAARVTGGLRDFLGRRSGTVAGYGAAAKGTMLLNAAAVGPADITCVADANPLKQGRRMPGCRIPIVPVDHLRVVRPDYLLILPWNIADEIVRATDFIRDWGGRHVVPSPVLRLVRA